LQHHRGMLHYSSAKEFLANMISLPSKLVAEDPLFWKMQERLSHIPFSRTQHEQFIKPVQPIILWAFKELQYAEPHLETEFLLLTIAMLWNKAVYGELQRHQEIAHILEKKYNLRQDSVFVRVGVIYCNNLQDYARIIAILHYL